MADPCNCEQSKQLAAEVARLQEQAAGWKAAALNRLGQCATCEGDGVMLDDDDDGSPNAAESLPCLECGGTGRGEIAYAFDRFHEEIEVARVNRDVAIRETEAFAYNQEHLRGELAAANHHAQRLVLDKRAAVEALTEVVNATTPDTALGQVARRALGLCR